MNSMDLQLKFIEAAEQAKAIMDLIETAENEPVADGTLWRAAQAARERIEKAEKQFHKLHRAYRKATKEGEPPPDAGDDVLDPPSEAGVRIGQHFDTLDEEQQDTIRRVLRQFPI